MSDDLLQLIFAAILILFGLLGSKKKRPTQQPPRQRPAPRPGPGPRPRATARPAPAPRPAPPRPAATRQRDALVQELERLLGAQVEVEESGELPEAVSLERTDVEEKRIRPEAAGESWAAGLAREAASLETLEEAGEKSHARFHARYDKAAGPTTLDAAASSNPPLIRLRRAIIWSEILGPPVSERTGRS
jgi:hypothetical protein